MGGRGLLSGHGGQSARIPLQGLLREEEDGIFIPIKKRVMSLLPLSAVVCVCVVAVESSKRASQKD